MATEAPPRREEEEEPTLVVGVSMCDSAPLLWRTRDLKTVRSHGLVGALLGSLPRAPRQNSQLGRPLLLLAEEEKLLAEEEAAAQLPAANQEGGAELHRRYLEEQQRSFEEQSVLAMEDRKSALLRAMTSSHTESRTWTSGEAIQTRLQDLDQTFFFPQSAMAVQLSTARAGLGYCTEARTLLNANRPVRAQEDPDCMTRTRYQVFRDLRRRGFFLTSAGKFGGDFLVYPGDPLRFHAHFIAICLSLDQSVLLLDVLAVARLGSNVKKTVLLCSPAPDGQICYTSLEWSGMV